jgi:membrane protein
MRLVAVKNATVSAVRDLRCNRTFSIAAGLAYYFLLSLFPLLIFMAAALSYIPIPNLFNEILNLMSKLVPGDAMGVVRRIVHGVLHPPRSGLLSFGIIATLWAASGGFAAMIDALNVAYDVPETRPYWKTRLRAIELTFVVGGLVVVGLGFTILGPRFGEWLAKVGHVGPVFAALWPVLRWSIILVSIVLAVELLYFLAPNVKQGFTSTLPGALLGVAVWVGASLGVGIYLREFANYNATYGTLGGVIALMLWFYVSAVAILVGGEINSELLKAAGKSLPVKEPDPVAEAKAAETAKAVAEVEERFEPSDSPEKAA